MTPDHAEHTGWEPIETLRAEMRARFAVKGTPTRFAEDNNLTDETVLSFLRGARDPAEKLLAALGWERETLYRCVRPCPCRRCAQEAVAASPSDDPFDARLMRMFLCEQCGNKRCPHAADHRNDCFGSNEPGQPGSDYPPHDSTPSGVVPGRGE